MFEEAFITWRALIFKAGTQELRGATDDNTITPLSKEDPLCL